MNNYYHDVAGGEGLFVASVNDTAGTVTLAHNRMINVTTNDPNNFSLGWGAYGCDTSRQTMDLFYNTFNKMNQHKAQLADCGAINIVGNEFTNIYFQYSAQHVDCIEIWGQAGLSVIRETAAWTPPAIRARSRECAVRRQWPVHGDQQPDRGHGGPVLR